MTRGMTSSRLVDQLVTIGLSTVGASGSLDLGGVGVLLGGGDDDVLELLPALALRGLDVDTGVRDGRAGELDGVLAALPDGRRDAVGTGSEGDAGGVDVQVAGDAGLGLGGDQVMADRPGLPRHREVEVVGAAGLAVAALVAGAGFALVAGAAAGLGAARRMCSRLRRRCHRKGLRSYRPRRGRRKRRWGQRPRSPWGPRGRRQWWRRGLSRLRRPGRDGWNGRRDASAS